MLQHLRTLRFKLTLLNLLVFGAILAALCVTILAVHKRSLMEDIDDRLNGMFETLIDAAVIKVDDDLAISARHKRRPDLDPSRFPSYFWQFRFEDGTICKRCTRLRGKELPWSPAAKSSRGAAGPVFETITGEVPDALLASGRSMRVATLYHQKTGGPHVFWQVGVSLSPVETSVAELRRAFLQIIPIGLLVAGFAGWMMARRSLAPIGRIVRETRELSASELDRRIAVPPGRDEITDMIVTINQMLDRLEGAFRAQERFVADAAHELKTPVAVLLGSAQVLTQKARTPEEQDRFFDTVQEEMRRLAQMVDSLLTLARSDAGLPLAAQVAVSVNDAVMDAVQACRPLAAQRDVRLIPRLALPRAEQDEAVIRGDPELIRSMLANLIRNAIRHSPAGEAVEVEVRLEPPGVSLTVRDRGPGIPPEHLDRVFDRFYRVPADGKIADGTGLGLAIAKGVVNLHHGTISIVNRPEGGCECLVGLTLSRAGEAGLRERTRS